MPIYRFTVTKAGVLYEYTNPVDLLLEETITDYTI